MDIQPVKLERKNSRRSLGCKTADGRLINVVQAKHLQTILFAFVSAVSKNEGIRAAVCGLAGASCPQFGQPLDGLRRRCEGLSTPADRSLRFPSKLKLVNIRTKPRRGPDPLLPALS